MDAETNNLLAYYDLATEELPSETLTSLKHTAIRYQDFHAINSGGMKKILSSHDEMTDRQVAMAVLHKPKNQADVENFIHEARIGAQLEHPNIVPIYDLGLNENDEPYFIMKKLSGINLRKHLDLNQQKTQVIEPNKLVELLEIFRKLCDAISYSHNQGIVHLDLKPANVQIDDYGQVLVCDWGLAQRLSSEQLTLSNDSKPSIEPKVDETLNGQIKGSPGFMAPEQISKEFGPRGIHTDIYALGAILYAMLNNTAPIEGETVSEIVEATLAGNIQSPKLARKAPHSLQCVALKALEADPQNRYQSATQVLNEIHAFQQGYATQAENASTFRKSYYYLRRHKQISITIISALSLVCVLGFMALIKVQKQRNLAQSAQVLAEQAQEKEARLVQVLEEEKINQTLRAKRAARSILISAKSYYTKAHYKKALESINYAISLDPNYTKAWDLKALLLFGELQMLETLKALEKASKSTLNNWLKEHAQIYPSQDLTAEQAYLIRRRGMASKVPLKGTLTHMLKSMVANYGIEDRIEIARRSYRDNHSMYNNEDAYNFDITPLPNGNYSLSVSGNSGTSMTIVLYKLPLEILDLSKSGVKNLAHLKGMPLKKLNISHTVVSELSPLVQAPLVELNLQGTYVHNLRPLSDCPLKVIHLPNFPIDLKPLLKISSLETIIIPPDTYSKTILESFKDKIQYYSR